MVGKAILTGALFGMAGLLWSKKAGAAVVPSGSAAPVAAPYVPPVWTAPEWSGSGSAVVTQGGTPGGSPDANVSAFLQLIRAAEGTAGINGYQMLVGGELFEGYTDHPRREVYIARLGLSSTAAGAYQILSRTWDEIRSGLPDFGPASQDAAAIRLIARRGAIEDVRAGRLGSALEKCSWEWAGLPPFRYSGQGTLTAARAAEIFAQAGGVVRA